MKERRRDSLTYLCLFGECRIFTMFVSNVLELINLEQVPRNERKVVLNVYFTVF